MKLILANRQTDQFRDFYKDIGARSAEQFDYSPYEQLLFIFDTTSDQPVEVHNLQTEHLLNKYSGVYINGYLDTYELAATVAICCEAWNIPFVNKELANPPSLSKLTAYAKLASSRVSLPKTYAGAKAAIVQSGKYLPNNFFPAVLKRADADRGIDNYVVQSFTEALKLLEAHDDRSIWLLQEFVPNNGFYLVSFYDQKPIFSIFRSLEQRPDQNQQKAHMYKPKGGSNATLLEVSEVPEAIVSTCTAAIKTMNRQIGSVDCIYDQADDRVYVLEVNYNPQIVTIETFKEVRVQAFLDYVNQDWSKNK